MPRITGPCFSHQQNGLYDPMTPHYCSMFSTSWRLCCPALGGSETLLTQPNPIPPQSIGAKLILRMFAMMLLWGLFRFFPLSLPESLSLKGPSALLLPAFNHWVVVPDKYLIPFKIPLIMHLPATCLQRFLPKPQPCGEHWDLLDYFSAREWKQRWLLIVFFLLPVACPSFIMTVVCIPSWPLCDLAWLHTWHLWSHETKKLQVLPWSWWPFVPVCACEFFWTRLLVRH